MKKKKKVQHRIFTQYNKQEQLIALTKEERKKEKAICSEQTDWRANKQKNR